MAKKQVVSVSYTCDVCGATIPDGEGDSATRKISWEGSDYVVDVCETHGSELGDILAQLSGFVSSGHRAGARRGRRAGSSATRASRSGPAAATSSDETTPAKRGDLASVRSWAQANGHKVGDRGRIPAAVLAAYEAAQGASEPAPEPEAAPVAAEPRKRAPRKASANGSAKATPRKRGPRKVAATV